MGHDSFYFVLGERGSSAVRLMTSIRVDYLVYGSGCQEAHETSNENLLSSSIPQYRLSSLKLVIDHYCPCRLFGSS